MFTKSFKILCTNNPRPSSEIIHVVNAACSLGLKCFSDGFKGRWLRLSPSQDLSAKKIHNNNEKYEVLNEADEKKSMYKHSEL
jgi:hypothetical protein